MIFQASRAEGGERNGSRLSPVKIHSVLFEPVGPFAQLNISRPGEDARNLGEHRSVYLSGRAT